MKVDTGKIGSKANVPEKIEKKKINMNYLRDKDRELVKGVFNFHESKGGTLKFAFRKWKGDKIEQYALEDGKVYTLPMAVAKHLNTSGRYLTHEFSLGPDGKKCQKIGKTTNRYGFQSLEFTSFDEPYQESENRILTVEEEKQI